jgi:DNA-binding NarL/FixJ family response regulator
MTAMEKTKCLLSKSSSPSVRIFLVEDSARARNLIIEHLTAVEGIAWIGISDSENDALVQLLSQSCDVLIVDTELKEGNGMSLLRKLSQKKLHEQTLKIVFSNNVCDAYRRAGQRYRARYFLDKSTDLPQLRALLEQLGSQAILS